MELSDRRDKSMATKLKRARKLNRPRRFAEARGYAASLEYATRLAKLIWERDWKKEAPHWQPLDDLLGVLTQIDNMLAGMEKKKRHNSEVSGAGATASNDNTKSATRQRSLD